MSDGTHRDRWIDEVFRTSSVSAEVKVFLLFLARYHMDPTGRVSEKRETLAEALGCHPRKVTSKFESAARADLMDLVVRGQKYRTAVYQATMPSSSQGASNRPPENSAQGAGTRPPENPQVAGFYHPENSAQSAGTRPPETPQGADNRPPEKSRIYKDPARAHSDGDRSEEIAEVSAWTEEREKISQSAQAREATRSLHGRYRLTDQEAAQVIEEVRRRAAKPIRHLARYLEGMAEGDLADIVAAVMEPPAAGRPDEKPRLGAVQKWCGDCDERTRHVGDPDRPQRCPNCHPLAAKGIPA